MSWPASLIPSPESREPLTLRLFFRDIVAPILCYYANAVLVLTPNTRTIRICALPLSLWTLFNGATRIDLVKGQYLIADRLVFLNQGLTIIYTVLSMRLITWALQTKPYTRVKTLKDITPQFYTSRIPPELPHNVFSDAFELSCNLRGIGWNWSQHLYIPHETRPTKSRTTFSAATFSSLICHLLMFDCFHYAIQCFGPTTIGSAEGGSIFNASLPPLLYYARSIVITFLAGMSVYCSIQAGYHVATLFGVLVFKQDTSLWPPAFKSPWLSTSLNEFWTRRWHQLFRDVFINVGGKPVIQIFGRPGGVIGVFVVSGILHDFGTWGMGRGTDFLNVGGFFIMNGLGICLEHLWRKTTGHRVGGWIGRLWTLTWVIGWGHILVEAWATKGLMGSAFLPQSARLTTYIFGPSW